MEWLEFEWPLLVIKVNKGQKVKIVLWITVQNNNNNILISIAPYGRTFRGADVVENRDKN